jgi:diguanylate cyclase (GGDEF)-like protein
MKKTEINETEKIVSLSLNNKLFKLKVRKVYNYILVNCEDVTDLKIKIDEIEDSSLKDELTGAYNRKKIDKIIDSLISQNICLIMCDIDDFKKINDTYGHLKGDEILKKLSSTIKNNLRNDDIFVRWGGEEFIVLLKNLIFKEAKNIAEKLRKLVNSIEIEEVGHFSCSFGVACYMIEKKVDFDTTFKRADDALYSAKQKGKNRVETYSP